MNLIRFLTTLLLVGSGFLHAQPVAPAVFPDGERQTFGMVAGGDSVSTYEDRELIGTLTLPVTPLSEAAMFTTNHPARGNGFALVEEPDPEKILNFKVQPERDGISIFAEQPTLPESLQTPVKRKLLPDNISFMERALWGENGFFRNIGIASPLTPESRKHELDVRRTMLTMHQIGGFVTLASMLATVYSGQKYLNTGQRNDQSLHQTFIPITIACYGLTGLLSVLSPPPVIRRDEISTTTVHKTLAWVHAAGMILTPILGAAINKRGASYYDQAHYHQIAAYITTAVFAASMIIITFYRIPGNDRQT